MAKNDEYQRGYQDAMREIVEKADGQTDHDAVLWARDNLKPLSAYSRVAGGRVYQNDIVRTRTGRTDWRVLAIGNDGTMKVRSIFSGAEKIVRISDYKAV